MIFSHILKCGYWKGSKNKWQIWSARGVYLFLSKKVRVLGIHPPTHTHTICLHGMIFQNWGFSLATSLSIGLCQLIVS